MELPSLKGKKGREWTRDLGCYFVKQLRRSAIEVSEKHLSSQELEAFKQAKTKEVKNFIVAQAFKQLPSHLRPSKNQILKMRWILTWKVDESPGTQEPVKRDNLGNPLKAKARAVVLGYMDPQYEHRPTSSPTMGRTTRQLFLQKCANEGFTVEKGDISGAFLQGDDFGPRQTHGVRTFTRDLRCPRNSQGKRDVADQGSIWVGGGTNPVVSVSVSISRVPWS